MDDSQLTSPTEVPRRRWLRFSLRFLLLAVFFVSCLFGALHWGRRIGYEDGYRAATKHLLSKRPPYFVTYDVADLIATTDAAGITYADFDPLTTAITQNVAQGTWDNPGCGIRCFKTNLSIVVGQTPGGHEMVEEFFDQLRGKPAPQEVR